MFYVGMHCAKAMHAKAGMPYLLKLFMVIGVHPFKCDFRHVCATVLVLDFYWSTYYTLLFLAYMK